MMRSLVCGMDRRTWRVVVVAMQSKAWPEETEELRRNVDALHVLEEEALLSFNALRKLRSLMIEERPQVVQTWMHHADFVGGMVGRIAGIREVVWGIHCREITRAPGESGMKAWAFARLMPVMSKWLPKRIVSCSESALEDHLRMGYPSDKMVWVPNGVDTQRFVPQESARAKLREELGIASDGFVVGFAGRFHEMKNLPLLLRAFKLLSEGEPRAFLVLCGVTKEELDHECQSLISSLPDATRVFWLPFQSDPENFYPGLDVFSLSSRTEACPMTILEAMACGVSCVATDVGDCRRLIGDTGTVVPPGDAEALACEWKRQAGKTEVERRQESSLCRNRVVEQFSIERAKERYQALYEALIEGRER